jgi:anti-sigma B factor antagonist
VVIADLTHVGFVGSAGLNALHRITNHAQAADVAFCVVSDQRAVLRPLHMTALDHGIIVHATLADARAWLVDQR